MSPFIVKAVIRGHHTNRLFRSNISYVWDDFLKILRWVKQLGPLGTLYSLTTFEKSRGARRKISSKQGLAEQARSVSK